MRSPTSPSILLRVRQGPIRTPVAYSDLLRVHQRSIHTPAAFFVLPRVYQEPIHTPVAEDSPIKPANDEGKYPAAAGGWVRAGLRTLARAVGGRGPGARERLPPIL